MKLPNVISIVPGSDLPLRRHLHGTVSGFAGAAECLIYRERNGQVMARGPWPGATANDRFRSNGN